jgi:hypothetical protein
MMYCCKCVLSTPIYFLFMYFSLESKMNQFNGIGAWVVDFSPQKRREIQTKLKLAQNRHLERMQDKPYPIMDKFIIHIFMGDFVR